MSRFSGSIDVLVPMLQVLAVLRAALVRPSGARARGARPPLAACERHASGPPPSPQRRGSDLTASARESTGISGESGRSRLGVASFQPEVWQGCRLSRSGADGIATEC